MHKERIDFLRNVVAEHLKKMLTIEDQRFKNAKYGNMDRIELKKHAVLNLDAYTLCVVDDDDYEDGLRLEEYGEFCFRLEDKPEELNAMFAKITSKYDCGFSGCFAGWYVLLARAHKFLTGEEIHEEKLHSYDLQTLATHFGITHHQVSKLFRTLGSGAEKSCEVVEGTANTEEALNARIAYLDELISTGGVEVEETADAGV